MTIEPTRIADAAPAAEASGARSGAGAASIGACCSAVYGSPLVELLVGDSLHPGGLASTRSLLEAARLNPGDRLLDIGCGLGASARLAAATFGLRVDAADASAPVISRARARAEEARIKWTVAGLPNLPFLDATFDAVLAECVLSTVDRLAALAELARVLRPGGSLILSDVEVDGDPIPALGHRVIGTALCVTDAWRPGELERLLPNAGFRIVETWDRSSSIVDLVDRIEARFDVVRLAARDLGLDLAGLIGPALEGTDDLPSADLMRDVIDAVRLSVRDGSLKYTAVVAVNGGPR